MEATEGRSTQVNIKIQDTEGFMGVMIPIMKLDDGNIEFWIPNWEWERVRDALTEALDASED